VLIYRIKQWKPGGGEQKPITATGNHYRGKKNPTQKPKRRRGKKQKRAKEKQKRRKRNMLVTLYGSWYRIVLQPYYITVILVFLESLLLRRLFCCGVYLS